MIVDRAKKQLSGSTSPQTKISGVRKPHYGCVRLVVRDWMFRKRNLHVQECLKIGEGVIPSCGHQACLKTNPNLKVSFANVWKIMPKRFRKRQGGEGDLKTKRRRKPTKPKQSKKKQKAPPQKAKRYRRRSCRSHETAYSMPMLTV